MIESRNEEIMDQFNQIKIVLPDCNCSLRPSQCRLARIWIKRLIRNCVTIMRLIIIIKWTETLAWIHGWSNSHDIPIERKGLMMEWRSSCTHWMIVSLHLIIGWCSWCIVLHYYYTVWSSCEYIPSQIHNVRPPCKGPVN